MKCIERRWVMIGVLAVLFFTVPVKADKGNDVTPEDCQGLRAAIQDLAATWGDQYPEQRGLLRRLDRIERAARSGEPDLASEFLVLQRSALLANPLLTSQPILFVVRPQYKSDHHNTATMFLTGEINTKSFVGGSAIKAIDLAHAGQVRTLWESKQAGVRDPEVNFAGDKIIFAMRQHIQDDYHIYEIDRHGNDLTQLTFAQGVADIDPLYMPDGSIVFGSTREPKYCMCNRHIMCNLFQMDADGANIHQIGKSTLHEGHPALLPDGRILYDRWEYVDRNFGDAQGLWTVNPDGTSHCVYWGNNTWSPGGAIDARAIPGTEKILCVFGSCHDRPWGALAIVDRTRGVDGKDSVRQTWPASAAKLVQQYSPRYDAYGFDNFKKVKPKYEDPYPLSDRYFLCSRLVGPGEQMGIFLLDVFGNEVLIHTEAPGCFSPMPLGPTPKPPQIPSRRDFQGEPGYLYVADVYQGSHMQGVERGAVKFLRVVESPEKRFWTQAQWGGQGVHCPAVNWHSFENKRILGTVPVEKDGSAYFEVPSDRFVYFQLLDKDKMMVQSMRSGTLVQSGEVSGCVGCHEDRRSSPPPAKSYKTMAMTRPASPLKGWKGHTRLFSYLRDVQPVFSKHCVECHDYGKEAGETLNLAADQTNTFNTSYNELWRKKYIKSIGAGPANIQSAYAWGAHPSKLIQVLRKGHNDVKLSQDDMERITTWIDINGPYYPRYDCAYPDHLAGRSPLDNQQIKRLTELTGVPLARLNSHNANMGPQVSFARPALSPCLAKLKDKDDAKYQEALAIITAGQTRLHTQGRADMDGFVACPVDQQREQRYLARQRIEQENRMAIHQGRRRLDR